MSVIIIYYIYIYYGLSPSGFSGLAMKSRNYMNAVRSASQSLHNMLIPFHKNVNEQEWLTPPLPHLKINSIGFKVDLVLMHLSASHALVLAFAVVEGLIAADLLDCPSQKLQGNEENTIHKNIQMEKKYAGKQSLTLYSPASIFQSLKKKKTKHSKACTGNNVFL